MLVAEAGRLQHQLGCFLYVSFQSPTRCDARVSRKLWFISTKCIGHFDLISET